VENVLIAKLTILLIMKTILKLEVLGDGYTLTMQNIWKLKNVDMLTSYFKMLFLMMHRASMHQFLLMLNSEPTAMENKGHSKLKGIKYGRHLFMKQFIPLLKLQESCLKQMIIHQWMISLMMHLLFLGAMRLSDKHACSECTQECKAVADFLPAANDAAAVLGVDEN
jgi:hypothetical protein